MIRKFETTITPFALQRTIHMYLPEGYEESEERYPVLYMYDGHNLFSDEDATYGKSWGLADFLDQYDKKLIVVGIECNHEGDERLNEFCPYPIGKSYLGGLDGRGAPLMEWVVHELKPYIDAHYRTWPFRECTAIGGSSMGGLMSLYTVIKHNLYFSKAACLSPSAGLCMPQLKNELAHARINPDTKVYLSLGTQEVGKRTWLIDNLWYFHEQFTRRKAQCLVNVVQGGTHSEAAWEQENPVYLDFLWK